MVSLKLVEAINEEDKLAFVVDSVLLYDPVKGLLDVAFAKLDSILAFGALPMLGESYLNQVRGLIENAMQKTSKKAL